MKVAELDGALLDLWAALADGEVLAPGHPMPDPNSGTYWLKMGRFASVKPCPQYSSRWADGGPIIEREQITMLDPKLCESGLWEAFMGAFPDVTKYSIVGMVAQGSGPTPLVAAMRAFVASKFGDEVPDA